MGSATAIYINEREAIAVRVEGTIRKPKISRAGRILFQHPEPGDDGLPPERGMVLESIVTQLRAWLRKSKLIGTEVILCADSASVILRDLKVAFTERRQIDKVIAFQVEGVIPSIDIEDLAVGYTVLEKEKDGSRLLVAAAHREPLRESMEMLEDASVTISMADSAVGGVLNLRARTPDLANSKKPTLWIDIQGDWALVAVLEGTTILGMRMVRVPAAASAELQAAAEASVEEPALDDEAPLVVMDDSPEWSEEDQTGKAESAPSPETIEAVRANADDLVRLLVMESRRSILSAQAAGAIQTVVLSGVPETLKPVAGLLKAELGVPAVEVIDLIGDMVPKDRKGRPKVDLPPSLMVPVLAGVALKGIGGDASGMDFLVGDLSPADTFDHMKSPLAIGVTILFLVCGVLLMLVVREGQKVEREATRQLTAADLEKSYRQVYAAAPEGRRKPLPSMDDLMAQSIAIRDQLQAEVASIKAGNKRNFPPMYEADRAYQEALEVVLRVLGETQRDGKPNTEHFFLQSFDFKQVPARQAGQATEGTLIIEAFVEVSPRPKRFDLRDALQSVTVPNPGWDGKDANTRTIPLFDASQIKAEPGTGSIDRGERRTDGKVDKIQIQFVRYILPLTKVPFGPVGGGARRTGPISRLS